MKSQDLEKVEVQQENVTNKHAIALKEAIDYLPRNFDQDTLIRSLKAVFPDEGQEIMIEWLSKCKFPIPFKFKDTWHSNRLSKYQEQNFDTWLNQNIYDVAENTGWVPKALRKGKQTKRPPRRKVQKLLEENKESTEKLHQNLHRSRERNVPDEQKSFILPQIINMHGGCYKHPYMKKIDVPEEKEAYLEKLDKLVDCEVEVVEAVEYIVETYGRLPNEIEVKYLIKLNRKTEKPKFVLVSFEELTTMLSFSRFLVSKGFVKFLGDKKDFDAFHHFLIKEQHYPTVHVPASWGEFRPGVFLFENGIFCTHEEKYFPADENDRIQYLDEHIVCPTGSEQVKPPRLQTTQPTTIQFITDTLKRWESFNGKLNIRSTIGYAVGCVFSRELTKKLDGFPMLFKFGVRGTGKSTSMDWFMALFGYHNGNRQSVSKQNTIKSVLRRMTLPRSFPFFMDDYRNHETNSNVPDLTSAFLNWFGRIGTGMAKKSVDNSTLDTQMKACVVMTGNDKPSDSASLTRLIMLNFNRHIKGSQIQEVHKISNHTDRLSEFLALILENYDLLQTVYFDLLECHREYLSQKNIEGRLVNNWSIILAGVECLQLILPDLDWNEEMDEFRAEVYRHILQEQELEKSQSELLEFFETLDYCSSQKKHPDSGWNESRFILDRHHFKVYNYEPRPKSDSEVNYSGPVLALHMPSIWSTLQFAKADIAKNSGRSAIESRIVNSELFVAKSETVYMFTDYTGTDKKNKRCYLLNLDKLEENGLLDELINKAKKQF